MEKDKQCSKVLKHVWTTPCAFLWVTFSPFYERIFSKKLRELWVSNVGFCTCGYLLDELGSIVATFHQHMSPSGQLFGRIHPEHMGLHTLLCARTQAKWEVGVQ